MGESAEAARIRGLAIDDPWRLWGPYQSGRQWGTVREDYSADGDAWRSFPFDHAHARAYRWGEDGIGGLCDSHGFLHLAVALWNGRDDRLKERWFGLTNPQGNHGEDVKEYWWPLDATPSHSYGALLYRYPQAAFPYADLIAENARRGKDEPEYELADTGILKGDRFFDVVITHAKAAPDDICVTIRATNRGPDPAPLHLVPQLWFRNTWAWGRDGRRPEISLQKENDGPVTLEAHHAFLGTWVLEADGRPRVMACDNETDRQLLYGQAGGSPYPKSAVHRAIVLGDESALNPAGQGTKFALQYVFEKVQPGEEAVVRLRLRAATNRARPAFAADFDETIELRRKEADAFYEGVLPAAASPEDARVARRAFAGLLWGKQVYRYTVREWLEGDPGQPIPPAARQRPEPEGRNTAWNHLELADVILMPDDWEYPWFAAWDLAFHCVTLAHVDPVMAKDQLLLLCREWAQHPDGQMPAYEWSFSDVNPPVHAWAAWQVYVADGCRDREFLGQILSKLLLNLGWWLNHKDEMDNSLFEGGFLGMDNISVFDRSRDVPAGSRLEQSDATSWVAFDLLAMLRISLELARHDQAWAELPTTFLERFLSIAEAAEAFGTGGLSLWDEADGFFYDILVNRQGGCEPVRVRSLVGLIPLLATMTFPDWVENELPSFRARRRWLEQHRPELLERRLVVHAEGKNPDTICLVDPERLSRLLAHMLDEAQFLSPFGIRSLSAAYRDGATVELAGRWLPLRYAPGTSDSSLFGGNSNWRGPVWMPVNVLLVDALRTFAAGAGRDVQVELPTGSGRRVGLAAAADDLAERLLDLFRPDAASGRRPSQPADHPDDPAWNAHPTFSEYFHGDEGSGLGASHQTGWTALVAHLICTRKQGDTA